MTTALRPLATDRMRRALGWMLTAILVRSAAAWGPHAEITAAALRRIATDSPIRVLLGEEWDGLTSWCWIPDRRGSLTIEGDTAFLTDDVLYLPGVPPNVSHTMPIVETTWMPYFRRALDALRMENSWNAARWIGTLLHFVQDSGAPPHAWPRGPHGIMENWVPASLISIEDHTPRLLGEDEESATVAFVAAMRSYVEHAAERGRQIEPFAVASNRPAVETLALVSANESAKMSADVLETLGRLAQRPPPGPTGELFGRLSLAKPPSPPQLRSRIMIVGQPWSTVSTIEGDWSLRRVPPGRYKLLAAVPGSPPWRAEAEVVGGMRTEVRFEPPGDSLAGRGLMNPDFSLRWTQPEAPDYWHRQRDGWESEPVLVAPGERVRLFVEWVPGSPASLVVRWRNSYSATGGRTVSEPPLKADETQRTLLVPNWATCARLDLFLRSSDPTSAVRRIVWAPMP